ncbi:MAG: two-component regulator propeller domain-containing protein [Calditrichia bacterium]
MKKNLESNRFRVIFVLIYFYRIKMKCSSAILLLLILLTLAGGQTRQIKFEHLGKEDGLSQVSVSSILQDRQGFMWFATFEGLNRYNGYEFTVYKNDPADSNSLSYNWVNAILEDHSGQLWIATDGGLNRYNPLKDNFTRFNIMGKDSVSLRQARTLYEDSEGNIWIGTWHDGGLWRMEKKAARQPFRQFSIAQGLSSMDIWCLLEDAAGFLWAGTYGGGLNRSRFTVGEIGEAESSFAGPDSLFQQFHHEGDSPAGLSDEYVRCLLQDHLGDIWVGTRGGGLDKIQQNGDSIIFESFVPASYPPEKLSDNRIWSLLEDDTKNLWIGTESGGINILNESRQMIGNYRNHPADLNSLSHNFVISMFQDTAGAVWLGTHGGGINKYDPQKYKFHRVYNNPEDTNSLNFNEVWALYQDQNNILWIGTYGGGLNRLDRSTGKFRFYRHQPENPNSLINDKVKALQKDRRGNLWIGTTGGISVLNLRNGTFTNFEQNPDDPGALTLNNITFIFRDSDDDLWIGTFGGGLHRYNPSTNSFIRYRHNEQDPQSISGDFLYSMYEDRQGNFWVGTWQEGLNRFDKATGRFSRFSDSLNTATSLALNSVYAVYQNKRGIYWIGTAGGGLIKYDSRSGEFVQFTEKNGLSNNMIYAVIPDRQENLWLSTNHGISRFTPAAAAGEHFRNYGLEDGLQGYEFAQGSAFQNEAGEIFFGGINGFNYFYPAEIKDNPYIPPVVFTRFRIMNRPVELDTPITYKKELNLSYQDRIFSLEFAALNYTNTRQNRYAYRLLGFDPEWVEAGHQRSATYTNLDAGTYLFQVKGSNNDGVWNEAGASLRIVVEPPFWKTWWAYSIYTGLFLLVVIGLMQMRIRKERQRAQVREMEKEIEVAKEMQQNLLPLSAPEAPHFDIAGGCLPAFEVGGDYYDFFWLDEGQKERLAVVLVDVEGKRMQAAFPSVLFNGMLKTVVEFNKDCPLPVIFEMLNSILKKEFKGDIGVCMLLGILDIPQRRFHFVNAGCEPPLLMEGQAVRPLESRQTRTPLGKLHRVKYQECSFSFSAGDQIIIFSDGISETRNGSGLFFSESLPAVIAEEPEKTAAELIVHIHNSLRQFAGTLPQQDDQTLLVIRHTG